MYTEKKIPLESKGKNFLDSFPLIIFLQRRKDFP